jgi:hypothetical protein
VSAQQRASDMLAFYFKTAFEAAGLDWDGDHYSEIEEAVGDLADMVREQVRTEMRDLIRTEVQMYLAHPTGGGPS